MLIGFRERGREEVEGVERERHVREKHQSVASHTHPNKD